MPQNEGKGKRRSLVKSGHTLLCLFCVNGPLKTLNCRKILSPFPDAKKDFYFVIQLLYGLSFKKIDVQVNLSTRSSSK